MGLRIWEEINSRKSIGSAFGLFWALGLRYGGYAGVGDLSWSRKKGVIKLCGLCMLCLDMVESMKCHSRVSWKFYFR